MILGDTSFAYDCRMRFIHAPFTALINSFHCQVEISFMSLLCISNIFYIVIVFLEHITQSTMNEGSAFKRILEKTFFSLTCGISTVKCGHEQGNSLNPFFIYIFF